MDVQVGTAGWRNSDFSESQVGKMHVFFHEVQRKNNFLSQKAGRPIFEPKVFIKKLVPGDSLEIDRPMRETDAEEFPVEWARYEQKKANAVPGTPIEAWPAIDDTQKAEFRAMHVFTVEQFANLNDSVGHKIMGFNDLRSKARAFVNAGNASAEDEALKAKLQAQDAEIAALRAEIQELARKKPGRKPKEALEA